MNKLGWKAVLRKRLNLSIYSALSKLRRSFNRRTEAPRTESLEDLREMGEPFASALRSMYSGAPQIGFDGESHVLAPKTRISIEEGLYIFRLCRESKAEATLEIGCAYGFSTLYILAALAQNPAARHVAIDPWENEDWGYRGIGVRKVREVGMEASFRLFAEPSTLAFPRLISEGLRFDLIFIDGNHLFDYALVDFSFSALVCADGGLIIFDDMWLPSIRKVVSFVRSNRRDFAELPTSVHNISVFRKADEDRRIQRDWKFFEDF